MELEELSNRILDDGSSPFLRSFERSLIHYGVKGMKWGVRKEYIHSPRKIKENFEGLTDKQKKILKIGLAVTAGLLLSYGSYRLGPAAIDSVTKFKRSINKTNETKFLGPDDPLLGEFVEKGLRIQSDFTPEMKQVLYDFLKNTDVMTEYPVKKGLRQTFIYDPATNEYWKN